MNEQKFTESPYNFFILMLAFRSMSWLARVTLWNVYDIQIQLQTGDSNVLKCFVN